MDEKRQNEVCCEVLGLREPNVREHSYRIYQKRRKAPGFSRGDISRVERSSTG